MTKPAKKPKPASVGEKLVMRVLNRGSSTPARYTLTEFRDDPSQPWNQTARAIDAAIRAAQRDAKRKTRA